MLCNQRSRGHGGARWATARVMPRDIENIRARQSGDMLVALLNYRVHYQEEDFSMYGPTAMALPSDV